MFWIGFAVGTAASCLVLIAGISAIAWSVGKSTGTQSKAMDKYWNDSLEVQNRNADTFERIEELLEKR